ncbi:energy transducer TonB [Mariniflexile sp. AS56]|uniref:energy transducer TonB n=1 Tax=Mariniflexile sp. AS56 TaxID=3063957 RepID=UPI0026ED251B|nr:energy transducer TonB [Mariniflexile sp. AS56]MDO7170812.1 energy transducer TonB [Mariniflexile sp. AS56]
MKYFETKHERDSAKLTTLISVIILLLLFVVGAPYMDPPEEYGVAVNFGTTDFGSGTVQPLKPIKSEPVNINKPAEVEPVKSEPTKAAETKEEVLTADNSEEIAIKKQKEAETKAKAIADAKAKAEAERVAKEKRELEEKKRKLDALIGGVSKSEGTATGGEGDDNKAGDKGQLDGDPYAPSYFGSGGSGSGGVGYGLNGRGAASYQTLKQDCNESGMVIVRIVVNKNGNVIEASPGEKGTTNTSACLLEPAKKIALSHKWRADPNAPTKQIGFVKVNFKLGQ